MKRFLGITAVALALAAAAALAAGAAFRWFAARRDLSVGQQAFDRREFALAASRFRAALDRDPRSAQARLSLADAYAAQYVPGGESEANLMLAERALAEYHQLLESDSGNRAAVRATAVLYQGQSRYEDAVTWYRRLVSLDAGSADAHARLSAAELTRVSDAILDARARAGLAPDAGGPIGDAELAGELRGRWSESIETGMGEASKALAIDASHEAAMATLSAWHRVRADLAVSIDRHRDELAAAESWRQKALAVRRTRPAPPVQAAAEAAR